MQEWFECSGRQVGSKNCGNERRCAAASPVPHRGTDRDARVLMLLGMSGAAAVLIGAEHRTGNRQRRGRYGNEGQKQRLQRHGVGRRERDRDPSNPAPLHAVSIGLPLDWVHTACRAQPCNASRPWLQSLTSQFSAHHTRNRKTAMQAAPLSPRCLRNLVLLSAHQPRVRP